MAKKVLIITYYWPPSGGAGVQRWLKFVKYLPEFGIDPVVLTVDPKSASYPLLDESLMDEVNTNVKVFATKSFEPLNLLSKIIGKKNVASGGFSNVKKESLLQTVLRFIRGNFFVPDARVGWNKFAYKKAKQIIKDLHINTVVTTSPPHSTQLIGYKLKKALGIKWIADFRDPWTDIYYYEDLLHLNFIKTIDSKMEQKVLRYADKVITNCNSNKALLSAKIESENSSKFQIITNGFDEEDFKHEVIPDEEFVVTYSGTISANYQPESFFQALSQLIGQHPETKFKLRMVGKVSPDIINLIAHYKLNAVFENVGYVAHEKLVEYLQRSTALLYIFPKTANDKGIAGKLFEYLAAKKPIIGLGPTDGDSAEIIESCGAGKMFEREEDAEIYSFLIELLGLWKTKKSLISAQGIIQRFSRKNLTEKIAELL